MKILYAEDEEALSSAVTTILNMEGFEVDNAYDGLDALEKSRKNYYDACIFDIMMPKMDGVELLKNIRDDGNFTPVIMLTAKTTTENKIEGLSSGADDYLCKPFETKELVARLNSILRRNSNTYKQQILKIGNVSLNYEKRELSASNGSLIISQKETELLKILMTNPKTNFSKAEINNKIFSTNENDESSELYVSYLINKLKQVMANYTIINENNNYKFSELEHE